MGTDATRGGYGRLGPSVAGTGHGWQAQLALVLLLDVTPAELAWVIDEVRRRTTSTFVPLAGAGADANVSDVSSDTAAPKEAPDMDNNDVARDVDVDNAAHYEAHMAACAALRLGYGATMRAAGNAHTARHPQCVVAYRVDGTPVCVKVHA